MADKDFGLAVVQQQFADGLLDPAADDVLSIFEGNRKLAARRFSVYRGNLSGHWDKTLGAAYPVIRQLVGEEFFFPLCRAYGRAYPSTCGDLNLFGDGFAGFLARFEPVAGYPYFEDVARLEWALHRAYYAEDDFPIPISELAELDAAALDALVPRLRASAELLSFSWDVVEVWLSHKERGGRDFSGARPGQFHALVFRPQWHADFRPLGTGEFFALRAVQNGLTLGQALEIAIEREPAIDVEALVGSWIRDGVLAR